MAIATETEMERELLAEVCRLNDLVLALNEEVTQLRVAVGVQALYRRPRRG